MEKKLTIILVGNDRIEETIRSLKEQVYKNIEVFLSEDNLIYKDKSLRQKFYKNEEFYNNINKSDINIALLKKVKSEYFTILKAGDTVGLDFYRQLMENKNMKQSDIIMGNTVFENNDKRWTYNLLNSSIPNYIDNKLIMDYFNKESKLESILILQGNKIYKSSLISKLKNNIDGSSELIKLSNSITKLDVDALFHRLSEKEINDIKDNNYYSIATEWDYGIEVIKENILKKETKYVSFDVFDTLIVRPFLEPRDEMLLINPVLNKYFSNGLGMSFYDIRFESELYARKKNSEKQDIKLDDIYEAMQEIYRLDNNIIETLKNKEIENEIKFCMQRKTTYEIFKFAKYLGKKVIVISDMYLSENIIKKMVEKCGYLNIDKYYVSSEYNCTKASGDLYDYVVKDLNTLPENIIHIGDNWQSDWKNSNDHGINGQFLPRTINLLYDTNLGKMFFKSLPFAEDNRAATNFLIIRCMLAIVANKYFDNPWKRYDESSIFNGDVALFGYYALGMNLYGIVKWMLDELESSDKKYDKIEFMARDGFLPQVAFDKMKKIYDDVNLPKSEYFYVSRKALIPLIFSSNQHGDMYKLIGSVNIFNHTPTDIIKYLGKNVNNDKEKIEKICKKIGIKSEENFENVYSFDIFLNMVRDELFDEEKAKDDYQKIEKYFKNIFSGETCTFDIGYSARPELLISKICNKPIDTFFINVNEQSAYENSRIGNFKIRTFLEYKPVVTGSIREILISKQGPSCIGYDCKNKEVNPIFEKYDANIDEWNTINVIQENALDFIDDMISIFGKELRNFDYYRYYTNIPLDLFINSPGKGDKSILQIIDFEDSVGMGDKVSITEYLEKEREKYNQLEFKEIYGNKENTIDLENMEVFDLKNRNKYKKLIYYILFKPEKLRNIRNKKIFRCKNEKNSNK